MVNEEEIDFKILVISIGIGLILGILLMHFTIIEPLIVQLDNCGTEPVEIDNFVLISEECVDNISIFDQECYNDKQEVE